MKYKLNSIYLFCVVAILFSCGCSIKSNSNITEEKSQIFQPAEELICFDDKFPTSALLLFISEISDRGGFVGSIILERYAKSNVNVENKYEDFKMTKNSEETELCLDWNEYFKENEDKRSSFI